MPKDRAGGWAVIAGMAGVLLAPQARAQDVAYHAAADPALARRPGVGAASIDVSQAAAYTAATGMVGIVGLSLWGGLRVPAIEVPASVRLQLPLIEDRANVSAGSLLTAVGVGSTSFQVGRVVRVSPELELGVVAPSFDGKSLRLAAIDVAEWQMTPYYGLSIPITLRTLGLSAVFWSAWFAPVNGELAYETPDRWLVFRAGAGAAMGGEPTRAYVGAALRLTRAVELGAFGTRTFDDPARASVLGISARIPLFGCWQSGGTAPSRAPARDRGDLRELRQCEVVERGLTAVAVPGKTTIIEFAAEWCGPCRAARPHLEALARQAGVAVRIVNADECAESAERQGVRDLPTFFIVGLDGEAVTRVDGADWAAIENALRR